MYIDHEHPNDDFIELGKIQGEDLQEIKTSIKNLILKINPEEKIEGVKILEKDKIRNSVDFDLPKHFEWSELELKIKEGKEDVEIFYKEKNLGIKSYVDLGFSANRKEHKPNREWNLLIYLSVFQKLNITEATPANLGPMFKNHTGGFGIKKDNVYQIKKILSDALKTIFKTEEDPFTDKKEYYEPKFKIEPEPGLRHDEIWSPRIKNDESQEPLFFKDNDNEKPYDDETLFNDEDSDEYKDINEEY
jgi:hypothetical protein